MKLTDLILENLIHVHMEGLTKEQIIDELVDRFAEDNAINSKVDFKEAVMRREEQDSTGIGRGVAVPHGQSEAVLKTGVAFGLVSHGVDWNSQDGEPVHLIFMVADTEDDQGEQHLRIMQMIAKKLKDNDYRQRLLSVKNNDEALELLKEIQL
ncbi:MAG: PTS sugar transporter subunit IIA [Alkalicoccus sp.]|nr:MAG: PTS sugar transporter subunit IIA [Alkalicoccus sp.]